MDPRVYLLTAAIGVIGSNSLALSPMSEAVSRSFLDASAAEVMIASAAYGGGVAVSALLFAPQIDRIGAASALFYALSILALALGVSAFAPSLTALSAAQIVAGLAAGCALPAIYALAAEFAEAGRESEVLGVVLTGWTLSMVAGVSLAAVIADAFDWRAVYGGLAALTVALIAALPPRRSTTRSAAAGSMAARRSSPLTALGVPGAKTGLLAVIGYMIAFYGAYSFLGPHLTGPLQASGAAAGFVALAYGVGFGAAAPIDRAIDRLGHARVAPPVFGALTLCYALLAALSDSYAALAALAVFWGAANHLGLNLLVARLTALDPSQRGAVMGVYAATVYACVLIGATAFRPIYETFGWTACALVGAFCVAPLFLSAALGRARR